MEHLCNTHIAFTHWCVRRWGKVAPNHRDYDDMLSEALMALVAAARGFDPDAGFSFRSYARTAIRRALARWCMINARRGFSTHSGGERWEEGDKPEVPTCFNTTDSPLHEIAARPEREGTSAETLESVARCLAVMTDRERQIVTRFFNGETIRAIAETDVVTHQAIHYIKKRALRRVREALGEV